MSALEADTGAAGNPPVPLPLRAEPGLQPEGQYGPNDIALEPMQSRKSHETDSHSTHVSQDNIPNKLKALEASGYTVKKREHWWEIWKPSTAPPLPREKLEDAPEIPLATASVFSKLTYQWVTPMLTLGYQRPLEATDLWKMDSSRESELLSSKFLAAFERRSLEARDFNDKLSTASPSTQLRLGWLYLSVVNRTGKQGRVTLEKKWRSGGGRRQASMVWSLNEVMVGFWAGGIYKVFGDVAALMGPLVIKALIRFSQQVYAANQSGQEPPNIGRGIGMAIGLFLLTIMASICTHQFFFRSMAIGVMARATLITAMYKKALSLTVEARSQHPSGKLITHLSSDISRIDFCAQWFHAIWTAPIQLAITLILLCLQIGPSALVGFTMFVLLTPVQTFFMKASFKVRQKSMKWTDARTKLLQELLASMQIVKFFTYEIPFLKRLGRTRANELIGIRTILIIRAANQAIAFSVPTIAAVLAFVTYAGVGNELDPAVIFTALSYFQLLRQPLMFLPRALSALTDAQSAFSRLRPVFEAQTAANQETVDPSLDVAIRVDCASFKWPTPELLDRKGTAKGSTDDDVVVPSQPFAITDLNLNIPRGSLSAIVGPVGSGKSSLLQALIGEMAKVSGTITFGGRIGYCQQSAWIQNTTLRDNVLFGQVWDSGRYWQAIKDSSLVADLELLPDGDLTEIGEKGINLSGGQKQRINIARALYFDADIILLDDSLSAVDAHVGKALFNDAILGMKRRGKTVLLITHALHFLPEVDHIYTLQDGRVVEGGTYDNLMNKQGAFCDLMRDFGGAKELQDEDDADKEEAALQSSATDPRNTAFSQSGLGKAAGSGKLEGRLMSAESRKTGSVGSAVYRGYLKAANGLWLIGPLVLSAALMQTAQVLSTVWITWWETKYFGGTEGLYMGVYAALGASQAIFTFIMGAIMSVMSYYASAHLYQGALHQVFHSPMSFFDTQPLGRLMGVFGRDIDVIDGQLADSARMFALTIISLLGSVIIVTFYFHYFLPIVVVVALGYAYFLMFYRASARELKRLDSMLRSLLYSHFSESLSGLGTIRAYGEARRFIHENTYYMDLEDRAYLLTAANARWLSVRLDFLGGLLVFAVAVMAAKGGGGLTSAQIALCLTYLVSLVQLLGMVTRQSAEVENNMNAVERLLHYSGDTLPQEPDHRIAASEPRQLWPAKGVIEFQNVVMSYRKGLEPVLKGVSMRVGDGEKIGIIGRTGAGKTSLTVALYRLAELTSGKISIDGIDISTLGLHTLRSSIAIITQDPVLFNGTIRSNLDPFGLHNDAVLNDALQRSCLGGADDQAGKPKPRIVLDTQVEDEGSNLSVGERSLVSLARALVKDSKIVVLDEATAAVDLETDSKIQETIRKEFKGKTLLCIAHRLRTILSWDRILVMSAGEIEEFDTPLNLYRNQESLFRTMCDRSNISYQDIEENRQRR